jgi:putative tricarboxylic transport membrane protein
MPENVIQASSAAASLKARRCGARCVLFLAASILAAATASAAAQDYPSRPITVVVPFAAGGPSDVVARIVTDHMAKTLGQSMVIENVGGAGGTLGSARVAAAPPDGYTLLAGSMGSHVAAPVLTPNVRYDSARDFEPIGFTAHAPAVIVARKDFPPKDLREFVDYVKKNGASVTQAHGGVGASSHMACLLFTSEAGLKPTLVAYRGTNPAMNDLVGGHVDFLCEQAVSVAQQIGAGAVKAYAVSSNARLAVLPDVPTAKEAGVDYLMSIWAGIFAPKGTPPDVIGKLAAALDKALDDPAVEKRLADLGGSLPTREERTPAKFDSFVKAEIARWSPILKAASAEAK